MANLLITGGAGFIGGNFVHYWSQRHPADRLVVLDALTYAGNASTIAGVEQAELVVGDIRDTGLVERLLRDHAIQTIVHFAAETHVDRSIAGPDAFIETNVVGTHSLLKAARAMWLDGGSGSPHRFHQISTDEVYGSLGPEDPPFRENSPIAPNSPYAASKAASDHFVRAYHRTYGLEVTTSHCSNNFGPFQYPEKLVPLTLLCALQGREIPIYGDGLNRRDWLHVEDHCRGIELCLEKGAVGESYNIGGGTELPNVEIVEAICAHIDRMFDERPELAERYPACPAAHGGKTGRLVTFVEDRPGHDRRYSVDDNKARRELGYSPRREFMQSLPETIDWYLANEKWWRVPTT